MFLSSAWLGAALLMPIFLCGCSGPRGQGAADITGRPRESMSVSMPNGLDGGSHDGCIDEFVIMDFTYPLPACPSRVRIAAADVDPNLSIPDRRDVAAAMRALNRRVRECGAPTDQRFVMTIVFSSSGRVEHARVIGRTATTTLGACAAELALSTTIPPFERPNFSVAFPFGGLP